MNILLINPANVVSKSPYVPLNLAYLGAMLEQCGYKVRCLDYTVLPQNDDELRRILVLNDISLVGLTACTSQIVPAYRLLSFIKNANPSIRVVMGGIHPTVLPQESLDHGADYVIKGEGELALVKLVHDIEADTATERIVSHKRIENLDTIPFPARRLFGFPKGYTTFVMSRKDTVAAHVITSRGCTGSCIFCCRDIFGKHITSRSAKNVVAEVMQLKNLYGVNEISFADDYFTHDPQRVIEICDLLIENRVNIRWGCSNTRVDSGDASMFKRMAEAGCYRVNFGVESGSERVLRRIGKDITLDHVRRAFEQAEQAGLLTCAYMMIGHHCEMESDIKRTIAFAKELNPDAVQYAINTPFPGTPLYALLRRRGLLVSEDWGKYQMFERPLFWTEFLSSGDILKWYKRAWLSTYLSPRFIIKRIRHIPKMGWYLIWTALRNIVYRILGRKLF